MKIHLCSFILILTFFSCQKSEYYIANNIDIPGYNTITKNQFDSILKFTPLKRLDLYTSNSENEIKVLNKLKYSFNLKSYNLKDFYILNTENINDTLFIYEIDHVDYLVYDFILNKTNEVPPATGNITGLGAQYKVNVNNGEIHVYPYQ